MKLGLKHKLRNVFAGTLLMTIPLGGCSLVHLNPGQSVDAIVNSPVDEKAYLALLQFEVTANEMAIVAIDLGIIKPGSKTAVAMADLLQQLTQVVDAAKQAKALNDAETVQAKVQEGRKLYAEILALLSIK